jgi:hypothetical protein
MASLAFPERLFAGSRVALRKVLSAGSFNLLRICGICRFSSGICAGCSLRPSRDLGHVFRNRFDFFLGQRFLKGWHDSDSTGHGCAHLIDCRFEFIKVGADLGLRTHIFQRVAKGAGGLRGFSEYLTARIQISLGARSTGHQGKKNCAAESWRRSGGHVHVSGFFVVKPVAEDAAGQSAQLTVTSTAWARQPLLP